MYKPPTNPKILELAKSYRDRNFRLSDLKIIPVDGKRSCLWCLQGDFKHKNRKWCSNSCSESAFAFANPQNEYGLNFLLVRQNWQCAHCGYSWFQLAQELKARMDRRHKTIPLGEGFDFSLMKLLKRNCPKDRKPEVDHRTPIFKLGAAISVNFDNHQVLCYSCHKIKTKIDLSKENK